MAQANCLNDGCDKGSWQLRKHPDDYARGITCPECGSTDVEVDVQEEAEGEARAPAPREPSRARPATQEMPPAVDRGVEGGNAIFELVNQNSRAEALQGIGAALMQFGSREEERRQQAQRRAESVDEVRRPEEYPQCPECDTVIKQIPEGDELYCPGCGIPLEVVA